MSTRLFGPLSLIMFVVLIPWPAERLCVDGARPQLQIESWAVSEQPVLDIGATYGDPAYELFRVVGAVRLANGSIVIGNAGTYELRLYDATGIHLRTVGREGEGPGEFRMVSHLRRLPSDSLAVLDSRLRRISVFSADGVLARTLTIQSGPASAPATITNDGSVMTSSPIPLRSLPSTGIYRDSATYYAFNPDGTFADTIGSFLSFELFQHGSGQPPNQVLLPFGHTTVYAAADAFYVGTNDQDLIRVFDARGNQQRTLRLNLPRRRVTDDDVLEARRVELARARSDERRARTAMALDAAPRPDEMPLFRSLLVDHAGHLWVEAYRVSDTDAPRWSVFDPTGAIVAEAVLPVGVQALDIGDDYVLGVWRDELDAEHVRLYTLRRR